MSLLPLLYYVIVAGVVGLPGHKLSDYNVCHTATCHEFGEAIQRNMDNSVEPCTDFYEYGCGSWATNNPIPSNQLTWSVDDQVAMKTYSRIREILEEESEYDKLPPIKMVKQYYRSCIDEDAIEKQGLEPMQLLLDATGGWPILMPSGEWNAKNYTWQQIDDIYNQLFSINNFFTIGGMPDEQNSTRNMLVLSLNIGYPLDEETAEKPDEKSEFYDDDTTYIDVIFNAVLAFAKHKEANLSLKKLTVDIVRLILFERKLRNITEYESRNHQLEKNETRMTIAELQKYYDLAETQQPTGKIDWLRKIQSIFERINVSIDASEPVIVYSKHLLHELAHLLDSTPSQVLVNYIQWNVVSLFMPHLNKKMRNIAFDWKYSIYNVTEQEPRWKTCIEDLPMQDATSYLFVKKYISADTLQAVTEMVEDIKAEMKARVLRSTWTNNDTKDFMINKMDNILPQIGYPKWYDNQTALIERYKGLEIGQSYFKNILAILMYETKRLLTNFRKPVDKDEWIDYPITVNAFYSESSNAIVIPAAEIQDPYFMPDTPLAVNYAVIGYTVGHELAHSFDSRGIQFDEFGNKLSWHSKETNEAYEEKAKCFVDQFSNYTLDVTDVDGENIQLDGEITKDENIADSVGVQVAFAAFQKRKMMTGQQPRLPGLPNITDEQLFFLSYVNAWCVSSREVYEEAIVNTDEHSPAKFRIIGSLANMNSFSKAFNCPINSPMNPESKCSLWK